MSHEALAPETHAKVLIGIEFASEEVRFAKEVHETEEFGGGDAGVDGVVGEEFMDGFDHEELEDAAGDDLVEEAATGGRDDDGRLLHCGRGGTVVFEVGGSGCGGVVGRSSIAGGSSRSVGVVEGGRGGCRW
jgi:hypothetical protein